MTDTALACFEQLKGYTKLVLGLSGGLDSMVLLHMLWSTPDLRLKLHVVHVNHGLSPHADTWQAHCEQMCLSLNLPLTVHHAHLEPHASNLEEKARDARFKLLERCIQHNDCLLLAHHQHDQAETLLLRLFRGAGVDGLASMRARRVFGEGYIERPLLDLSKHKLEHYAQTHALSWVDDESNQNLKFSRNYLRHHIIPCAQSIWPQVVDVLGASAKRCEEAQANLEDLAHIDCPELARKQDVLNFVELLNLPSRRLKNILRVWFKQQGIKALSTAKLDILVHELMLAEQDASPLMMFGDVHVRRYRKRLYLVRELEKPDLETCKPPRLRVPQGASITLRFRQGGEKLVLHGQTKSLKKLFQAWAVPPWERDRIPLVFVNDTLAAVLDFAIGDDYHQLICDA